MSDELADVALAFCREVLGYDHASIAAANGDGTLISTDDPDFSLRADLLDSVLAAVRWVASTGSVRLESRNVEPSWHAEVWLETAALTHSFRKGTARHNDACHALLAACLAAQRSIRQIV